MKYILLLQRISKHVNDKSQMRQIDLQAEVNEDVSMNQRKRIDLGKLIPVVDVSGSMAGTPMEVAIALGILISELSQPAFRDRMITFSSVPSWIDLSSIPTLELKVRVTMKAQWGLKTNLDKVMELIIQVIRQHKLSEDDIPDLIIFSDMQFDIAVGNIDNGKTQLQRITKRFHDIGIELTGKPYNVPRIIF